jgi:sortase A
VTGGEIVLEDVVGSNTYVYGVTEQRVVPPNNVEVMNAVKGKSIVSLQSCALPVFAEHVVV